MDDPDRIKELFELKVPEHAARFVVYSPKITPRLQYCCRFIFNHVLKVQCFLTDSETMFAESSDYRINYSYQQIPDVFRIKPHQLTTEDIMLQRRPEPFFRDNQIYFFPNTETEAGLDFDLFSAVFYFISRHEEWQDFEPDRHNRFDAPQSILYSRQFHNKPVVDQWILEFNLALRRLYPGLKFPEKKFRIISTIDVDNVYAYRHKGFVRTAGAIFRDLLKLDISATSERLSVFCGWKKDPFDIYEDVSRFCNQNGIPLFWFFLLRSGQRYDRAIDHSRPELKKLLNELSEVSEVGLHPSYESSTNGKIMEEDLRRFSDITGENPGFSRQHYLRFDIRSTPGQLSDAGVKADFTMGFAGNTGFRAGTSHPFYYFDFKNNRQGALLFVPFCLMDGVFTYYNPTDSKTALVNMLALAAEIKNTGGNFISVFHERTFSDRLYRGYGSLYKKLHLKLVELQGR